MLRTAMYRMDIVSEGQPATLLTTARRSLVMPALMTSADSPNSREVLEHRFDQQLQRLFVVFGCDVLLLTFLCMAIPAASPLDWTAALIPIVSLGALFPAGMGAAALWIRRSRFALAAGTLAAGLTVFMIAIDLLAMRGFQIAIAGFVVFVGQVVIGILARRLAQRNILPRPLRLATFAFLFKLAIVGLLAAAFVPADRNPLRVTGWLLPAEAGVNADANINAP